MTWAAQEPRLLCTSNNRPVTAGPEKEDVLPSEIKVIFTVQLTEKYMYTSSSE